MTPPEPTAQVKTKLGTPPHSIKSGNTCTPSHSPDFYRPAEVNQRSPSLPSPSPSRHDGYQGGDQQHQATPSRHDMYQVQGDQQYQTTPSRGVYNHITSRLLEKHRKSLDYADYRIQQLDGHPAQKIITCEALQQNGSFSQNRASSPLSHTRSTHTENNYVKMKDVTENKPPSPADKDQMFSQSERMDCKDHHDHRDSQLPYHGTVTIVPKEEVTELNMDHRVTFQDRLRTHDPSFWQNNMANYAHIQPYASPYSTLHSKSVVGNTTTHMSGSLSPPSDYLNSENRTPTFSPFGCFSSFLPSPGFHTPEANISPGVNSSISPASHCTQRKEHVNGYDIMRGPPSSLVSADDSKLRRQSDPVSEQREKPSKLKALTPFSIADIVADIKTSPPSQVPEITVPSSSPEPVRTTTKVSGTTKDPPRYACDRCGKTYSTHGGLSMHKQFHCTTLKKQFSCKYCEKTYTSMGALRMHIRTHTLPCKCKLCGKAFSRPWLLQGHVRTHTGEKPFQCPHCSRAFADRSNLRAHLQTHSDIKRYNCKTCVKTFSRMSLLLKHEDGGCVGGLL